MGGEGGTRPPPRSKNYCRELPALDRGPAFCQTASHNDYTDNFVSGKSSNNDYTDCRGMSEKLALELAPFPSRGRETFSIVNDNTWCMASCCCWAPALWAPTMGPTRKGPKGPDRHQGSHRRGNGSILRMALWSVLRMALCAEQNDLRLRT